METAMTNKKEAGQALIFTAAALVVLMGFAGLAIDMGVMRHDKRLQQTAADAAAIAGASNWAFGGVTSGAQDAASRVGYTDNGGGEVSNCVGAAVGTICVQVNNPPCGVACGGPVTGPHNGQDGYVEVLVADVHPTYFMKILGINSETITARAVATNLGGGAGNGCLYTLGPPSSGNEGISGSGTLNASTCGIVDNGEYDGSVPSVTADTFAVSGSSKGKSATCTTPGPCPTYDTPATSDPLGYLTPPPVQAPTFGMVTTAGTQTLQPGTYSSITIGNNSTVTLNPGIYYIDGSGGVSSNGTATVQGTGVMLYFTNGASIDTVGSGNQVSNIQLSAPTTGSYAGILMYQDRADTNTGPGPNNGPTLGGDDNSFFKGALYFPEDQLTFIGNTTGAGFKAGIVVADSMVMKGSPIVTLQGNAGLPSGVTLINNATLVE
jgi:putative Flp pilus-assembly TadE/G-like protein